MFIVVCYLRVYLWLACCVGIWYIVVKRFLLWPLNGRLHLGGGVKSDRTSGTMMKTSPACPYGLILDNGISSFIFVTVVFEFLSTKLN